MAIVDRSEPHKNEGVKSRMAAYIYAFTLATCGFYYGIQLGTFNSFATTWVKVHLKETSEDFVEQKNKYITFFLFFGCTTACLIGSMLVKWLGLYRSLILNHVLGIAFVVPMIVPNLKLLYLLRYLQGISAYLWTTIAPLLIKDCFPFSIADKASPAFNTCVACGVLIGYVFGFGIFERFWQVAVLFPLLIEVPKLVVFATVYRMDSPAWMAANRKSRDEIRDNYLFLYEATLAGELADDIMAEQAKGTNSSAVPFTDVLKSDYRLQLVLALILNLLNQLTGMNVVTAFSTEIMAASGVVGAAKLTIGLGFVGAIATGCTVFLLGWFGKRNLLIWGLFGQAVGLCLFLCGLSYSGPMIVAGLYIGICTYNISLGGVLFAYVPDIIPPIAVSYCAGFQWMVACALIFFKRWIVSKINYGGMFFIAQLCAVLGGIFYLGYGIDTTEKSAARIKEEFNQKTFFG